MKKITAVRKLKNDGVLLLQMTVGSVCLMAFKSYSRKACADRVDHQAFLFTGFEKRVSVLQRIHAQDYSSKT